MSQKGDCVRADNKGWRPSFTSNIKGIKRINQLLSPLKPSENLWFSDDFNSPNFD